MKKMIVIGSGIGGLATAIRLELKGYDVHVYEKNDYPGGKLTVLEGGGFRFDAGPSVFTLPHLVTELFELAGKNPSDYFEYIKHPVSAKYFWNDGTIFTAPANQQEFIDKASETFKVDKEQLAKYFKNAQRKFNISSPVFLNKSIHKPKNYWSKDYITSYPSLITMDIFKSMNATNKASLSHPKLTQVMDKFASYIGSNPYKTPGIMTLLPHLEITEGVYFPKEGMHAITQSIFRLAKELGVEFHFNSPVQSITTVKNKVTGIQLEDQFIASDFVFCNTDAHFAHKHLLKTKKLPFSVTQERSSSVVVFYWGINREFKELDLHNMFYPDDYQAEFEGIFNTGKIIEDASIYIHRSCHVNPSDAPQGMENWFVMIMVPSDTNKVTAQTVKEIRKQTIEKLNRILHTNIEQHIVFEDYLSPQLIEQKTNSYHGALHGVSTNSAFSFFYRHSNFSKKYKNLHFVGGSTHPGGGIPQCLQSAKIATHGI